MPSTPGTINFPSALDTAISLFETSNKLSTTLNGGISSGVTSIVLTSGTGWPNSGTISIESEICYYTGKSGATLTGVLRAQDGTSAAAHSTGVTAQLNDTSRHHQVHSEAIIATQTKLGTGSSTPTSGMFLRGSGVGASAWGAIQAGDIPSGVDAANIGSGVVSNTEFGYLDGVTSGIQTQLNAKQASGSYLTVGNNLSDIGSASTARTNLGLGTLATQSGTFSGTSSGTNTGDQTFNGLSPMTTLGDVIYGGTLGAGTRLAGNTTSTRKFLRQTGTGSISAAPAWDTVLSSDVGLGNVENTALSTWAGSASITTLGTISSGIWQGTTIPVARGGSGLTSLTTYALLCGGTTSTNNLQQVSGVGTVGQLLTSVGSGALPAWGGMAELRGTPVADPGQGNFTSALMLRGADSTSGAPYTGTLPSVYLQTFRAGTNTSNFGFLWNFNSSAQGDHYINYTLGTLNADMTGAAARPYYSTVDRNLLVLSPTNIGSLIITGYAGLDEARRTVANVRVFGREIDIATFGFDAEAEDFSSRNLTANLVFNQEGNAHNSAAVIFSGANGTAPYKGMKFNPNSSIRHSIDLKDNYFTLEGTLAFTNGSGAVVGTGTKFLTQLVGGASYGVDIIQPNGVRYQITAVTDDTHATISPVYAGTTASGLTVAKYVVPIRIASESYIVASNAGGTVDYRFVGLTGGIWDVDPDGRATRFGGIVQVPSPLQIGGNTASEIALKRIGTLLTVRLGDDSDYTGIAASYFRTTTPLITATGASNPVFGTNFIGGTGGPATATQNSWVKMQDSSGATIWIPAWK